MNQKHLYKLIYLTLDAIGIIFCLVLAILLKFGVTPPRDSIRLITDFFYILLFAHLLIFIMSGLYNINRHTSMIDIVYKNFWTETIAILTLTVFFLLIRTYGLFRLYRPDLAASRGLLLYIALLIFVYITGWRFIYLAYLRSKGEMITRIAIVGSSIENRHLIQSLETYSSSGHKVIGVINPQLTQETRIGNMDEIPLNKLESFIRTKNIEEIILASDMAPDRLLEIVDYCQQGFCTLWIYPSLYEVMIGRLKIQEIAGIPLIEINPTATNGLYRIVKRFLDILISLIGLLLAIPLIIVISVLIKLDSEGPVLYTQKRLGKDGKIFILFKFRTMEKDAETITGAILASEKDPRITRIGRFLRKTRLDEIPQLASILLGDMSFVGPRPERPELMDKFISKLPHFHKRLAIRPGLTGLAQIQGRYDLDIESKLRYDLAYIYNMNLLIDLKIMFATIKVVFTGKGAR